MLAMEAATKVVASVVQIFEAKVLNGPPSEIERYRDGARDAFDTFLERTQELIEAQMRARGIDPKTRRLL